MGANATCSWDDVKQTRNLKSTCTISLTSNLFDGRFTMTNEDRRFDYGELRYNMLVELNGRIINVTFNPRQGKSHLISVPKVRTSVSAEFDRDIVDWFKSQGRDYKTRMNSALRGYMDAHRKIG